MAFQVLHGWRIAWDRASPSWHPDRRWSTAGNSLGVTQEQHHSAKGNYTENIPVNCIETNSIVIVAENFTDGVLGKVLATDGIDVVLGNVLGIVLYKPIRQQYPGGRLHLAVA